LKALQTLGVMAALCTAAPGIAWSVDWELSADMRVIDSDGQRSLFDGGLGALRYDSDHDGVQVGRLRAALTTPLGDVFALKLDASYWGQDDAHPVGLTEAFLEYRPYPFDGWRARVRLGAFYPPVSLEDTASGWSSPYTLSNSALNSWIGEEIRTIGLEAKMEWLGTRLGHDFDLGATAGVFGWNDPAGVVVATGGFSMGDFQTPLFGYIGGRNSTVFPENQLFHEIDGHAGYYVGAEARYLDRVTLLGLHYDNRADPAALDTSNGENAWDTHFDSIGLRVQTAGGWTAIIQWLKGTTSVAPNEQYFAWPFYAKFALISRQWGRNAVSARYDIFGVDSSAPFGFGDEDGHAWTVAYVFNQSAHWRFALEWLHVTSEVASRAVLLNEPTFARENQTQLSIRYTIGSDRRY
jgi:hypothetical protein